MERTSGGIAKDHIAIPAVPPAKMMAPRLRSEADDPAGVNAFLVISYAAKYLISVIVNSDIKLRGEIIIRSAAGSITSKCCTRSTEDAPYASFSVEVLHYIKDTLVLRA